MTHSAATRALHAHHIANPATPRHSTHPQHDATTHTTPLGHHTTRTGGRGDGNGSLQQEIAVENLVQREVEKVGV